MRPSSWAVAVISAMCLHAIFFSCFGSTLDSPGFPTQPNSQTHVTVVQGRSSAQSVHGGANSLGVTPRRGSHSKDPKICRRLLVVRRPNSVRDVVRVAGAEPEASTTGVPNSFHLSLSGGTSGVPSGWDRQLRRAGVPDLTGVVRLREAKGRLSFTSSSSSGSQDKQPDTECQQGGEYISVTVSTIEEGEPKRAVFLSQGGGTTKAKLASNGRASESEPGASEDEKSGEYVLAIGAVDGAALGEQPSEADDRGERQTSPLVILSPGKSVILACLAPGQRVKVFPPLQDIPQIFEATLPHLAGQQNGRAENTGESKRQHRSVSDTAQRISLGEDNKSAARAEEAINPATTDIMGNTASAATDSEPDGASPLSGPLTVREVAFFLSRASDGSATHRLVLCIRLSRGRGPGHEHSGTEERFRSSGQKDGPLTSGVNGIAPVPVLDRPERSSPMSVTEERELFAAKQRNEFFRSSSSSPVADTAEAMLGHRTDTAGAKTERSTIYPDSRRTERVVLGEVRGVSVVPSAGQLGVLLNQLRTLLKADKTCVLLPADGTGKPEGIRRASQLQLRCSLLGPVLRSLKNKAASDSQYRGRSRALSRHLLRLLVSGGIGYLGAVGGAATMARYPRRTHAMLTQVLPRGSVPVQVESDYLPSTEHMMRLVTLSSLAKVIHHRQKYSPAGYGALLFAAGQLAFTVSLVTGLLLVAAKIGNKGIHGIRSLIHKDKIGKEIAALSDQDSLEAGQGDAACQLMEVTYVEFLE